MSRAPGWYVDPDGEPAMRYWDGADWTSRTRPISTEDLPPLDFLIAPEAGLLAESLPAPVSPVPNVATMAPLPPVEAAEDVTFSEPARKPRSFDLLAAFLLLLPATLACLLPAAWAVRRFGGWPGWTAYAAWIATATILLVPPVRRALARMAPTRPASADRGGSTAPLNSRDLQVTDEPIGQLAAMSWLVTPLIVTHRVVTWSVRVIDRFWSFLQHLAESGRNRRTTSSTVALVVGIVRATVFWLLWATAGLVWMLLHGLRFGTDGLLRAAAVLGDRIRR